MEEREIKVSAEEKEERWGSLRFRIYELSVMKQCLDCLEGYEKALNSTNLTLQSVENIRRVRKRLDEILIEWNLRNPSALNRIRNLTITTVEWTVLQNGLCVTIGLSGDEKMKENLQLSDEFMKIVKHLHRRFELFPVRIAAGLRTSGYKINEEEAERLIKDYKTHDSATAIKPLVKKE